MALKKFIDKDDSGSLDVDEFKSKVTLKDYQQRSHKFLISEMNFIDKILAEWYDRRAHEKEKVLQLIHRFDESQDNKI